MPFDLLACVRCLLSVHQCASVYSIANGVTPVVWHCTLGRQPPFESDLQVGAIVRLHPCLASQKKDVLSSMPQECSSSNKVIWLKEEGWTGSESVFKFRISVRGLIPVREASVFDIGVPLCSLRGRITLSIGTRHNCQVIGQWHEHGTRHTLAWWPRWLSLWPWSASLVTIITHADHHH